MFGPITIQERIDTAAARIAASFAALLTGTAVDPEDYLPTWAPTAPREQMTPEQMIAFMRGFQKRRKP